MKIPKKLKANQWQHQVKYSFNSSSLFFSFSSVSILAALAKKASAFSKAKKSKKEVIDEEDEDDELEKRSKSRVSMRKDSIASDDRKV